MKKLNVAFEKSKEFVKERFIPISTGIFVLALIIGYIFGWFKEEMTFWHWISITVLGLIICAFILYRIFGKKLTSYRWIWVSCIALVFLSLFTWWIYARVSKRGFGYEELYFNHQATLEADRFYQVYIPEGIAVLYPIVLGKDTVTFTVATSATEYQSFTSWKDVNGDPQWKPLTDPLPPTKGYCTLKTTKNVTIFLSNKWPKKSS